MIRRGLAPLALALVAACVPLRVEREPATSGSVIVVGCGPDAVAARRHAERQLRLRIRAELERRERAAPPAERVRDWSAVDRALDEVIPSLVHDDALEVGGDAVISQRLAGDEFEAALEHSLAAGRRARLRVACVPLEVRGDSRPLFAIRELYGSALREALEQSGLAPLSTDEVYAALDKGRIGSMDEDNARLFGSVARVAAVVCGSVRAAGDGVAIDVVLRDARSGKALGGFSGLVDDDSVVSVARRQAVVLQRGLGLE